MHHTKDKGDLGVFKVQSDLAEQGFTILFPLTEHAPFDLVAYKDGKFSRIQVKFRTKTDSGMLFVQFSSSWADKNGNHIKLLDKDEVDYIAVYCPNTDECYYFDPKKFGHTISLRLDMAKNGNYNNVHYADQYRLLGVCRSKPPKSEVKIPYKPQPNLRKVERPSKELLGSLLWAKPTTQIAKELGVSDNAVKKWAAWYGLSKPGRGYWTKLKFERKAISER